MQLQAGVVATRPVFLHARRFFHDIREYKEDKRWPGWQVVIGIETHAQIKSRRKLFSESLTSDLGALPNSNVSAFDAAFPGTLPRINPKCVDLALRTALALRSDIQLRSSFDRKHYFYSDLPSGYQITQQYAPLALNGRLEIKIAESPTLVPIRIKQIQLEQDTAKSTFNPRTRTSHIDLNRAGTGLMEIVSEPDLRSPEEAATYVRTLQAILRAVGSSDGNMEQGSMRCDVNVSINRRGSPAGTRCEIKNLNSVRFMVAAINHEINRQQTHLLTTSDPLPQETRGFDENTFCTYKLRSKEDAPDYRYMPDPNLGMLVIGPERVRSIRETLPLLPSVIQARLLETYQLPERDVDVLLALENTKDIPPDGEDGGDKGAIAYFERLCKEGRDPKIVANWMTHELLGQLSARKEGFKDNTVSSAQLGELIDLIAHGVVTGTSGKLLLRHMLSLPTSDARSPVELARDLNLIALTPSAQLTEPVDGKPSELRQLCNQALTALPSETAAARQGQKNVLNKIVGWVMRESRGRADAREVRRLVETIITESHDPNGKNATTVD
ncbi:Glutamyl-tRNA amidotransferase subunit B, mitochondrial [Infundibulicybe gibba]|nr:Glutamyl-tRNA amidotransferase subunit B, mitochondrial [Infundibulicybe gibba]